MAAKEITLYKYVAPQYIEDIIKNDRLYLNDGTNFNDPFETLVINKRTNKSTHINGLHILSLTNSYRNKLMWSHYADSYKGVCFTVQIPRYLVYPICYSTNRVYKNSNIDKLIHDATIKSKKNVCANYSLLSRDKKIALIKDKKWIYEKEYRLVFNKDDESNLICLKEKWYIPVKIKNIYFGINFDKNAKENIVQLCKKKGIKFADIVLSNMDYSLNVERKK